jgi:hypothetical protein
MTCTALRACSRSAGVMGGLGHSWKETISNRCLWSRRLNQAAVLRQKSHPPSQMSQCRLCGDALSTIPASYSRLVHVAGDRIASRAASSAAGAAPRHDRETGGGKRSLA